MIRTITVAVTGLVLLVACTDNAIFPPNPNPVVAVYDEVQRDTTALPMIVSQDAHCTVLNRGGWVALNVDGSFALSLDNTTTTCDTAGNYIPSGTFWTGTYQQRDTVINMFRAGNARPGADITAVYVNRGGGYYPSLTFHFQGHDYVVVDHEGEAAERQTR